MMFFVVSFLVCWFGYSCDLAALIFSSYDKDN